MLSEKQKRRGRILYALINAVVLFVLLTAGIRYEHLQPLFSKLLVLYLVLQGGVLLGYELVVNKKSPKWLAALEFLWCVVGIGLLVFIQVGASGLGPWVIAYCVVTLLVVIVSLFYHL